ncbi:MAG: UDP-N-acetylglucosamine 2-epimerase (non-hydrolyzing) [Candidatus Zixiibacteriota bacterium]
MFGTRPQLIKLASVWRLLSERCRLLMVDSGQHYDRQMAGTFYSGKGIRMPDINLGIRARTAGSQVARIAGALEPVFAKASPKAVVTFGDTSTTAGAAIAAAYQNISIAHIEAGLRSHDKRAAEEKNRILTDHLSRWLFCPTRTAIANLRREGITDGVHGVGDVLLETFRDAQATVDADAFLERFHLASGEYYLITCHRAETVDNPTRLRALVGVLEQLDAPSVFTVHPRARKNLIRHRLWSRLKRLEHLQITAPLDHSTTIAAISEARAVLTDSGGVQREAFWSQTPCLTLRDRTEWPETVKAGGNVIVDLDIDAIRRGLSRRRRIRRTSDPYFGKTGASRRIVDILMRDLYAL